MQTYIALLRGINVGGKHKLPMKELKTILEDLGSQNVKTYIQSGNVVLQNKEKNRPKLSNRIATAIKDQFGFEPLVLLLELKEFEKAINSSPFPKAESEPKTLHLYFLTKAVEKPDLEKLNKVKKENEQYELIDRVFYLYTPDGIGRSKLAEQVEKALGVSTSARNWRTVNKIMEMVREIN